jgi:hypothetical protein
MSGTTWRDVDYFVGARTSPAIDAFVEAITGQFLNGDCVLRLFEAKAPAQFDAALVGDIQGLDHCLATFLGRPEVREGLKEVDLAAAVSLPPAFQSITTFELEGALTHMLLPGGAYTDGIHLEERARTLARDFVDALVGEHRLSCTVFKLFGAWTPWFCDVAWDYSFVLMDRGGRSWWTIFMTDAD